MLPGWVLLTAPLCTNKPANEAMHRRPGSLRDVQCAMPASIATRLSCRILLPASSNTGSFDRSLNQLATHFSPFALRPKKNIVLLGFRRRVVQFPMFSFCCSSFPFCCPLLFHFLFFFICFTVFLFFIFYCLSFFILLWISVSFFLVYSCAQGFL